MDLPSIIQIVLAIILLVSMVATYFSSKTWQIAQVVLVFLILLASAAYWYLAAATLKLHQSHRDQVARLEEEVRDYEQKIAALATGTDDESVRSALSLDGVDLESDGVRQLKLAIAKLTLDRGRVWHECQAQDIGRDGSATIVIEKPAPHAISAEAILFIFEEGPVDEGAKYLGEFKVAAADEGSIQVQPVAPATKEQVDKLSGSELPWVLYEVMPIDRHDIFADMDEETLAAMLPEASVPEYLKDGQEAEADDPPDRVIENRYVRELRDYEYQFAEVDKLEALLAADIERIKADSLRLKDALEKVKKNVTTRGVEKGKLDTDLASFVREHDLVAAHRAAVARQYTILQRLVATTLQNNRRLVARLAQAQLDAAQAIDRRTGQISATAPALGQVVRP